VVVGQDTAGAGSAFARTFVMGYAHGMSVVHVKGKIRWDRWKNVSRPALDPPLFFMSKGTDGD